MKFDSQVESSQQQGPLGTKAKPWYTWGWPGPVWVSFYLAWVVSIAACWYFSVLLDPKKPLENNLVMLPFLALLTGFCLRIFWTLLWDLPLVIVRRQLDETSRRTGIVILACGGFVLLVVLGSVALTPFMLEKQPMLLLSAIAFGVAGVAEGFGAVFFRSRMVGVIVVIYALVAFVVYGVVVIFA